VSDYPKRLPNFRKLSTTSYISLPIYKPGHTDEQNMPCTVYAFYSSNTGTIILDTVWVANTYYGLNELEPATIQHLTDAIAEVVAELEFADLG